MEPVRHTCNGSDALSRHSAVRRQASIYQPDPVEALDLRADVVIDDDAGADRGHGCAQGLPVRVAQQVVVFHLILLPVLGVEGEGHL